MTKSERNKFDIERSRKPDKLTLGDQRAAMMYECANSNIFRQDYWVDQRFKTWCNYLLSFSVMLSREEKFVSKSNVSTRIALAISPQ
jgi:hypothetical protein